MSMRMHSEITDSMKITRPAVVSIVRRSGLPWGLPFGAFALALDSLTRLFLLPVFVLGCTCALSGGISLRNSDPSEHNLGAHWLFFLILLLGRMEQSSLVAGTGKVQVEEILHWLHDTGILFIV